MLQGLGTYLDVRQVLYAAKGHIPLHNAILAHIATMALLQCSYSPNWLSQGNCCDVKPWQHACLTYTASVYVCNSLHRYVCIQVSKEPVL